MLSFGVPAVADAEATDDPARVRTVPTIDPERRESIDALGRELGRLSRSLIAWIGERTDYDVDAVLADPPSIVFARPGDRLAVAGAELSIKATTRGAYFSPGHVVVLVLPWYPELTHDRAALLHELAHAVQLTARDDWRCHAETEWEAYQLQRRWLAERGVTLTIDWLRVGILSRCPKPRS